MILKLDVMVGDRFYCTLRKKCDFEIYPTDEELREYVLKKLPTLKNKEFTIVPYTN